MTARRATRSTTRARCGWCGRFRRGIAGNVQYTWAKSIDNVSSFGGGGGAVVALYDDNLSLERGLSSFDVRHTLQAGWVWTFSHRAKASSGPRPSTYGKGC